MTRPAHQPGAHTVTTTETTTPRCAHCGEPVTAPYISEWLGGPEAGEPRRWHSDRPACRAASIPPNHTVTDQTDTTDDPQTIRQQRRAQLRTLAARQFPTAAERNAAAALLAVEFEDGDKARGAAAVSAAEAVEAWDRVHRLEEQREQTAKRTRHSLAEARRLRDEACGALDRQQLAVSDALELGSSSPWDAITDRARELAAHAEQHRQQLAVALHAEPYCSWGELLDAARRRADTVEANNRADIAAADQRTEQAAATLAQRHQQMCDALGCEHETGWPDLIETARRIFEAGPVRRAAVVDAEQRARDAETGQTRFRHEYEALLARWREACAELETTKGRLRDTAANLRDTENQLAASRKDAANARIRAGRYVAERNRYRNAWRNARRRATLLAVTRVCGVYQPPTTPEDSGYCARCGMTDWKHGRG